MINDKINRCFDLSGTWTIEKINNNTIDKIVVNCSFFTQNTKGTLIMH